MERHILKTIQSMKKGYELIYMKEISDFAGALMVMADF